jgi:hypothetical protein
MSVAAGRERPVKSKQKHWSCVIVGSATVPTSIGGHGGPPYGPQHLKFHTSAASGRERPVKSNEKLMNIEHRTSNIE